MTPEGRVKETVKLLLKEAGAYKHMPVQNGMGEPALDFHVSAKGFYAAIETKAKGKKPTGRQIQTILKVLDSGGSVFVIDSTDSLDMADLIMWLAFPKPGHKSPSVQKLIALGDDDESRDDRLGNDEHPK
jgi:hypothetical protein